MFVTQAIEKRYQQRTPTGFLYHIGADFPAFKGHFEAHPLLPAVCQLSLCVDASCRLLQKSVELTDVKRAKFLRPIVPDMWVEVRLVIRPDGWLGAQLVQPQTDSLFSQLVLQVKERKK